MSRSEHASVPRRLVPSRVLRALFTDPERGLLPTLAHNLAAWVDAPRYAVAAAAQRAQIDHDAFDPDKGVLLHLCCFAVSHDHPRGADASGDAVAPAQRAQISHDTIRPDKRVGLPSDQALAHNVAPRVDAPSYA